MTRIKFDWRWIGLIVLVAILANASALPWPIVALSMAAGGGYILFLGWRVWNGGTTRGPQVTYWRGQRIEKQPVRGSGLPPWSAIGPAILYLVIGAALLLAALAILLRQFGL